MGYPEFDSQPRGWHSTIHSGKMLAQYLKTGNNHAIHNHPSHDIMQMRKHYQINTKTKQLRRCVMFTLSSPTEQVN